MCTDILPARSDTGRVCVSSENPLNSTDPWIITVVKPTSLRDNVRNSVSGIHSLFSDRFRVRPRSRARNRITCTKLKVDGIHVTGVNHTAEAILTPKYKTFGYIKQCINSEDIYIHTHTHIYMYIWTLRDNDCRKWSWWSVAISSSEMLLYVCLQNNFQLWSKSYVACIIQSVLRRWLLLINLNGANVQ